MHFDHRFEQVSICLGWWRAQEPGACLFDLRESSCAGRRGLYRFGSGIDPLRLPTDGFVKSHDTLISLHRTVPCVPQRCGEQTSDSGTVARNKASLKLTDKTGFFNLLLKTGAQVLHGFTTLAASSGVLFLVAGIHGGTSSEPLGWTAVIVTVAAVAALALLARGPLSRLGPTQPRG